jgi:hypothetical protein
LAGMQWVFFFTGGCREDEEHQEQGEKGKSRERHKFRLMKKGAKSPFRDYRKVGVFVSAAYFALSNRLFQKHPTPGFRNFSFF